jgi:hypothetical protein
MAGSSATACAASSSLTENTAVAPPFSTPAKGLPLTLKLGSRKWVTSSTSGNATAKRPMSSSVITAGLLQVFTALRHPDDGSPAYCHLWPMKNSGSTTQESAATRQAQERGARLGPDHRAPSHSSAAVPSLGLAAAQRRRAGRLYPLRQAGYHAPRSAAHRHERATRFSRAAHPLCGYGHRSCHPAR